MEVLCLFFFFFFVVKSLTGEKSQWQHWERFVKHKNITNTTVEPNKLQVVATYLNFVLSPWTLLCSSLRKWTKNPFSPLEYIFNILSELIKECLLIKKPKPNSYLLLNSVPLPKSRHNKWIQTWSPGDRNCKCQSRPGRTQPPFPAPLSLGCWALLPQFQLCWPRAWIWTPLGSLPRTHLQERAKLKQRALKS